MSQEKSPESMRMSIPFTEVQKEIATQSMVEAYCKAKETISGNENSFKQLIETALRSNNLSLDMQYMPEVTNAVNQTIQVYKCSY